MTDIQIRERPLLIDNRAGSSDLSHYVKMPHIRTRLNFGDCAWTGILNDSWTSVGVEVKKVHDFVHSFVTGRLWGHQIPGMLACYDYSYILIEGETRIGGAGIMIKRGRSWLPLTLGSRTFTGSEFLGMLNSVMVMGGIMPLFSGGREESGLIISLLWKWWGKPCHLSHLAKNISGHNGLVGLRKPGLVNRIAMELPGVGVDKADKVGKHFPSVLDMMLADEAEWRKIEGIGSTTAGRIVAAIRGRAYDSGKNKT